MKKKNIKTVRLLLIAIGILVVFFLSIFLKINYENIALETCYKCNWPSEDVCKSWRIKNCEKNIQLYGSDGVPDRICNAYNDLVQKTGDCNHSEVARVCECIKPYGIQR